ncbi:MAG: hypothetical protein ACQGQO_01105 [Sphaerochaetaceae bacterium]
MKNIEVVKVAPPAPKSLGVIGAEHWRKTLKILVPAERITRLDLPIIEILCQTWERIQIILGSDAPDWTQYRALSDMYLKFIDRYGATPRARKILNVGTQKTEKKESEIDADIMEGFKL